MHERDYRLRLGDAVTQGAGACNFRLSNPRDLQLKDDKEPVAIREVAPR